MCCARVAWHRRPSGTGGRRSKRAEGAVAGRFETEVARRVDAVAEGKVAELSDVAPSTRTMIRWRGATMMIDDQRCYLNSKEDNCEDVDVAVIV